MPFYSELFENGEFEKRSETLREIMTDCTICPHNCRVDRTAGVYGKCDSGEMPLVSSYNAHFGEEAPLVGRYGSGTIFFTNCNLACIFCQNYDISQLHRGSEVSFEDLAAMMIQLQKQGCHNINFVTPTHMIYSIMKALCIAIPKGLSLPLVYNSGGYDSVETLRLLRGVFDIYMPDFKYMDSEAADTLSGVPDYPQAAMDALREMHDQVGDLELDDRGIAVRGLLVRHLVLPNNLASSERVVAFVAGLSKNTYINIMDQFRPEYRYRECFDLGRRITLEEYDRVVEAAKNFGLTRIDRRNRGLW